jgi:hypothetical protein
MSYAVRSEYLSINLLMRDLQAKQRSFGYRGELESIAGSRTKFIKSTSLFTNLYDYLMIAA